MREPGGPGWPAAQVRPWPPRRPAGMLAPMTQPDPDTQPSRAPAPDAGRDLAWRSVRGRLALPVRVGSRARAGEVAPAALPASGTDADRHLHLDLRPDRAELSLQTRALGEVTGRDTQLARRISGAVA